jgi:hypothetical protein
MREPFTEEVRIKQKDLTVLIENLLEQEEIHWQQRGRANWLRHGDRNTTYYHNFASARKRKNLIKRLKDSNGDWVEGNRGLVPLISDYFSNLFTREVEEPDQALLDVVRPCVTPAMNTILTAPYTAEEVKKSLFQIGDMKAPGPDGLHAIFFKRFWHILGDDLTKEVLLAVNECKIPDGWNATNIVLIPKIEGPELITQYRPISL